MCLEAIDKPKQGFKNVLTRNYNVRVNSKKHIVELGYFTLINNLQDE